VTAIDLAAGVTKIDRLERVALGNPPSDLDVLASRIVDDDVLRVDDN